MVFLYHGAAVPPAEGIASETSSSHESHAFRSSSESKTVEQTAELRPGSKMASQTAIRWPLPSTGSLSGCILPAAALNHLEVPFKTEPVCPLLARRFGQRGRHAEACLTAAFDPWSSSFLSASNETPVSAHKQPQRASSLRKVVLHPADTSCRGKRRQSGLRAASNVAVSGDRGQESRIEEGSQKKRIAVFVSGGGSNYKAIQAAIDAGKVNGEVVAVISDKPGKDSFSFLRVISYAKHTVQCLVVHLLPAHCHSL